MLFIDRMDSVPEYLKILFEVSAWSALPPIIAGALRWRKLACFLKILFLMLCVHSTLELINITLGRKGYHQLWHDKYGYYTYLFHNIDCLIMLSGIAASFFYYYKANKEQRTVAAVYAIGISFMLFNLFLGQGLHAINTYSAVLLNLSGIFLALFYFHSYINPLNQIAASLDNMFIVSCGLLFMFASTLLVTLVYENFLSSNKIFALQAFAFQSFFSLTFNCVLLIAFSWSTTTPK